MEKLLNELPKGYFGLLGNPIELPDKAKVKEILNKLVIEQPYLLYEGPDTTDQLLKENNIPYYRIVDEKIIDPNTKRMICVDSFDNNESWAIYYGAQYIMCLENDRYYFSALKGVKCQRPLLVQNERISNFLFREYVKKYDPTQSFMENFNSLNQPPHELYDYLKALITQHKPLLIQLLQQETESSEPPPSPLPPPTLIDLEDDGKHNISMEVVRDPESKPVTDPTITLLSYYFKSDSEDRQKEFLTAISNNVSNPFVKQMILFVLASISDTPLPDQLNNEKIKLVSISHEPTYKEMIEYANDNFANGDLICLHHLDVFLDPKVKNWETLFTELHKNKIVYAQSCYETDLNKVWRSKRLNQNLYSFKQDAWIMMLPFPTNEQYEVPFGRVNSGSVFATALSKSEYHLINHCNRYRMLHLDNVDKSKKRKREEVEGERYAVPDMDALSSVSVDMLCQQFNVPLIELYEMKCRLLSKYLK